MTIEVDLKEIKHLLSTLNEKIYVLLEDRDNLPRRALAEKSLKNFLEINIHTSPNSSSA